MSFNEISFSLSSKAIRNPFTYTKSHSTDPSVKLADSQIPGYIKRLLPFQIFPTSKSCTSLSSSPTAISRQPPTTRRPQWVLGVSPSRLRWASSSSTTDADILLLSNSKISEKTHKSDPIEIFAIGNSYCCSLLGLWRRYLFKLWIAIFRCSNTRWRATRRTWRRTRRRSAEVGTWAHPTTIR